jgi:hypothetical protein
VVIPQIAQVEPAERARTMADYRFAEDEVDWTRPQREVLAQADSAGLPVLDALPAFQAAPQRDALYLPLDEHFTAAGHRLTAELLADAISSHGWLSTRAGRSVSVVAAAQARALASVSRAAPARSASTSARASW